MKFKNTLLIFTLLFINFTVFAQSADAVIADYFKAIGGRDKVAAIKTMTINGNMEVMGGSSASKVTVVNGKGYKSEMSFNGQNIIQSITDTGAWMINPFMGSSAATSIPADQYNAIKDEIYVGGDLFTYKDAGATIQYAGMQTVDGKPAKKLQILRDSVTTVYYIDSATNMINEKDVTAAGQTTTIKYSNYKTTDAGVMMAYTEELNLPQGITINYTINNIAFNTPVDPSVFAKPKQ